MRKKQSTLMGDFESGATYTEPFTSHSGLILHIGTVANLNSKIWESVYVHVCDYLYLRPASLSGKGVELSSFGMCRNQTSIPLVLEFGCRLDSYGKCLQSSCPGNMPDQ